MIQCYRKIRGNDSRCLEESLASNPGLPLLAYWESCSKVAAGFPKPLGLEKGFSPFEGLG